jgi:hypothetical protein
VIRTDKGKDLWDRAVADGVIEWRPGSEDEAGDLADGQARGQVPLALGETPFGAPGEMPAPEPASGTA